MGGAGAGADAAGGDAGGEESLEGVHFDEPHVGDHARLEAAHSREPREVLCREI